MITRKSDWSSLKSVYDSAFFCSLGFFFVRFIIPIVAYDLMGASGIEVALIFSLLTLGAAVFSPVAGAVAKRGRRRGSIFLGASIRAIAYVGMSFAILQNSMLFLVSNSLVWGLGAAFYQVGSDAEISERVLQDNRAEAFGHRSAANARGSVIGAVIGFVIIQQFDFYVVFLFYAAMNVLGGFVVISKRPPLEVPAVSARTAAIGKALGRGIFALVVAAAIEAFALALLSPFVELFILHSFTTVVDLVALAYLPSGIISAVLGGPIGKYADRSNQVAVVAGAALIVSVSTFLIAFIPALIGTGEIGLLFVAVLFTIEGVAGTAAYMVMSSVMGTAYEGRASEGFGRFEAAMGFARFSGPLVGGLFWDIVSPIAPFIFVGIAELLLIPAYYFGMKKYRSAAVTQSDIEVEQFDTST
ncbi:MAG: MFS transporter [Candidatus Thorarchaeota archaeon]|nr:MAG: MFS transporter [Candidatus Thorarchaeota archaeon]